MFMIGSTIASMIIATTTVITIVVAGTSGEDVSVPGEDGGPDVIASADGVEDPDQFFAGAPVLSVDRWAVEGDGCDTVLDVEVRLTLRP